MGDLKLGPLPKQSMVRVTIVLWEPLKEELDAHAVEHSTLYEPVETTALIPHMLQAFLLAPGAAAENRGRKRKASRRRARPISNANTNDRTK